ncbi:MAG: Histidine--tRNA ligase [Chlamydiia bacterium]|nr:Histidine--tRNA ligase [Chlamydiia bacterium]MCH9616517.1 Histidine--tRNA ligase [Chlamydiia bacterium]MCH9629497.1 Histidine--tRNA ligase [Chlamydiia bacterium]
MKYKIPKGLFDILPDSSEKWLHLERVCRDVASRYGFHEVRTPIFERTELFTRCVGETSDIVSKEMYTFEDKAGRSMSLRPEGTAPVMRAYLEGGMAHSPHQKVFYIGPYFRYDRPQAGRFRQFHQFGVESIGSKDPVSDFETIDLLYNIYSELGLTDLVLLINSIGNEASRKAYRAALQEFLRPHYDKLGEDSKVRFEKNPLRILDTKDEKEIELIKDAPSILDYLDGDSRAHFDKVLGYLDQFGIGYQIDTSLVRGLDYYNETVFEFTSSALGAQSTIGAGGRYDGLLASFGGPDLPGVGFATGMERILLTLEAQGAFIPGPPGPMVYFVPLDPQSADFAIELSFGLRRQGVSTDVFLKGTKVQKGMQMADKLGAKFACVIGENERGSKKGELKHLESKQGTSVNLDICTIKEHIHAAS